MLVVVPINGWTKWPSRDFPLVISRYCIHKAASNELPYSRLPFKENMMVRRLQEYPTPAKLKWDAYIRSLQHQKDSFQGKQNSWKFPRRTCKYWLPKEHFRQRWSKVHAIHDCAGSGSNYLRLPGGQSLTKRYCHHNLRWPFWHLINISLHSLQPYVRFSGVDRL